jgi:hypothetical protein
MKVLLIQMRMAALLHVPLLHLLAAKILMFPKDALNRLKNRFRQVHSHRKNRLLFQLILQHHYR